MTPDSTLPRSRLEVGKPFVTFEEVREGGPVKLIWVQVRLDADWVAAYRLVPQDRRLVLAEAREFPYEESAKSAGEWSGDAGSVPTGGLPFDKLRELRTDSVRQQLNDFLEWVDDAGGTVAGGGREYLERIMSRFQLDPALVLSDGVHTRGRRTDADLARAAKACADAGGEWKNAVMDEMICSESSAYKWRRAARDRGFLDADDKLTDSAQRLLAA